MEPTRSVQDRLTTLLETILATAQSVEERIEAALQGLEEATASQ